MDVSKVTYCNIVQFKRDWMMTNDSLREVKRVEQGRQVAMSLENHFDYFVPERL